MISLSRLLFLCLLATLLGACTQTVVPPPKSAATYFQEGENYFDKGLYDEAAKAWEKVRDSYYSPELNVLAEMKIAEAYYQAGRYVEAATAYEDFIKQHPDHERTEEALYQLGMSYYHQILSADRDQTATRNALVTFETLIKRFPKSNRVEEAKAFAARCRNRLAAHELYVGRFYLRTGHPKSTVGRLQALIKDYPNFINRDAAWYYLGKAYLELGDRKQAVVAFNTLYRDYPGSEYILDAQKFVEKRF